MSKRNSPAKIMGKVENKIKNGQFICPGCNGIISDLTRISTKWPCTKIYHDICANNGF